MKNSNNLIKRKSQIKMFETVAILVVFFFIIAIGFAFYASISKTLISREAAEQADLRSIQFSEKITFLPEIKCTSSVSKEIGSCIDLLKADKFGYLVNTDNLAKEYYYDILGYSDIKIIYVYPEKESILVYSKPKPNYRSISTFQVPVVLLEEGNLRSRCGPEFSNAKCSFALLQVGVYS